MISLVVHVGVLSSELLRKISALHGLHCVESEDFLRLMSCYLLLSPCLAFSQLYSEPKYLHVFQSVIPFLVT